jgi:hypothetical protein
MELLGVMSNDSVRWTKIPPRYTQVDPAKTNSFIKGPVGHSKQGGVRGGRTRYVECDTYSRESPASEYIVLFNAQRNLPLILHQLSTVASNVTANSGSSSPYSTLPSITQLNKQAPHPDSAPKGLISTNCTPPSSLSATS